MWRKMIFVFGLVFVLAGCSATNEERENVVIDFINHENHELVIFIDDDNLASPNGLAFDGEYIYIADTLNHDVMIYDIQGNYAGRLGGEGLTFEYPVAVAVSPVDGSIFVADESNGRIQMIQNGIHIQDFFIENIRYVLDIEVDADHNLYVSVLDFNVDRMKIYVFNAQGERIEIGQEKIGVLGRGENNEILFAQTYELMDDGALESGASFFAQIENEELIEIAILPNYYTPSAIFSRDGRIYLFSHGFHTLDVFDFEGNYIETLYENEISETNRGMFYMIAFGSDAFLITDNELGIVYQIRPRER